MRAIEQYSDAELKDELARREREREKRNVWHVYEMRKHDGAIFQISRHSGLSHSQAIEVVNESCKGYRADTWWHFCAPATLSIKEGRYNV